VELVEVLEAVELVVEAVELVELVEAVELVVEAVLEVVEVLEAVELVVTVPIRFIVICIGCPALVGPISIVRDLLPAFKIELVKSSLRYSSASPPIAISSGAITSAISERTSNSYKASLICLSTVIVSTP